MEDNEIKMDETILDEDTFDDEESEECSDICLDEESDDGSITGILVPVVAVGGIATAGALAIKNKVPQRIGAGIKAALGAFKQGYKDYEPETESDAQEVEYTIIEDSKKDSPKEK